MNDEIKNNKPVKLKKFVKKNDPMILVDYLHQYTKLSKSLLKKLMNNGAVWVTKDKDVKKSKRLRVRRAQCELAPGQFVECFYDPKIADIEAPESRAIIDRREWGIWFKPANLLAQGTDYGDHVSILRQVEKAKGEAFLIHRLDREASGLMLFAYQSKAAKLLSQLFQNKQVKKIYHALVVGEIKESGKVDASLDGKSALTLYRPLRIENGNTWVEVEIETGRLHQIRRHMDFIGHPLLGDPKYGKNNKNTEGMQLIAYKLEFIDPFSKKLIQCTLE